MRNRLLSFATLLPLLTATAALAQGQAEGGDPTTFGGQLPGANGDIPTVPPPPPEIPYSALLTDWHVALSWVLLITLWWLVAVAITAVFGKNNYPPNVATFACWLCCSGALICFFVVILDHMMHHTFGRPIWLLIVVIILILLVITVAKRSNNT